MGVTAIAQGKSLGKSKDNIFRKEVTFDIDITEPEDTLHRKFRTENERDTSIVGMMAARIRSGALDVYSGKLQNLSTKLTGGNAMLILEKTDTIFSIDSMTGSKQIVITYDGFNKYSTTLFRIFEDWVFDINSGTIRSRILSIAPLREIDYPAKAKPDVVPMFWVRYDEVKDIIATYDSYHPQHTIADAIWKDYFSRPENHP